MTLPAILDRVKRAGFVVFEHGNFNLNLCAVRTVSRVSDSFDDWFYCTYKVGGMWRSERWPCTTDPGLYHLKNPGRVAGTAILVGNRQYRSAWRLSLHRGKYEALCQRTGQPVSVWRDNTRDEMLDIGGEDAPDIKVQTGIFGINIHRSSLRNSPDDGRDPSVGKWSAGCIVLRNADPDFATLINLAHRQVTAGHGERFSLTLLED